MKYFNFTSSALFHSPPKHTSNAALFIAVTTVYPMTPQTLSPPVKPGMK